MRFSPPVLLVLAACRLHQTVIAIIAVMTAAPEGTPVAIPIFIDLLEDEEALEEPFEVAGAVRALAVAIWDWDIWLV